MSAFMTNDNLHWVTLSNRDTKYYKAAMKKVINGAVEDKNCKIKSEKISSDEEEDLVVEDDVPAKSVSVSQSSSEESDAHSSHSDDDRRQNTNNTSSNKVTQKVNNSNVNGDSPEKRSKLSLQRKSMSNDSPKSKKSNKTSEVIDSDAYSLTSSEDRLQTYMKKQHPSLVPVNEKLSNEIITENDDVWLIQCPMSIDLESFKDVNILQTDKKKLKLGNTNFECVKVDTNQQLNVSLLVPPTETRQKSKISTFNVRGSFVLREKVKKGKIIDVVEEIDAPVPFPKKLKKRHPLLGHVYKELLTLPDSVQEKLKESTKNKSEKRKSKIENKIEDVEPSKKSKRKRQSEDFAVHNKKVKKEKDLWTSTTDIERSLFE